jgi:hypothetical protein
LPPFDKDVTATVTCPGCQERDELIAALERHVAELEATAQDRTARLGSNATNSGTPPSANPPGTPKAVTKTRTARGPAASRDIAHGVKL